MSRKFLTPAQLSARWSNTISPRTLANWRSVGKGPRFTKIGGRVVYEESEIEKWEQERSVQSTWEYNKLQEE
ncbi:helix-turn-helix transcriptional regulator [Methylobacterium soli]|uniref:Helix-turn-helix domain-containing protein n=1 Tax=Methylobacterium soli TaxID=553447 RepID=A0A6L3SXY3_9HYPH|nr:helix-turn-helix domain-containing protein [Methylobacterium soli]KAB1078372.1 helix-turn-helix domain-containing protein [Methylobacterium soli]GJE45875.1 hypothetical protein AEGHOMDF_5075 [Methylobacterium soli]